MLVFCFSPAVPLMLALSFLNQRVRRCRGLEQPKANEVLPTVPEEEEVSEKATEAFRCFTRRVDLQAKRQRRKRDKKD